MKPCRWIAAALPCVLALAAPDGPLLIATAHAAECSVDPAQLAFGPVDTLSASASSAVAELTINCDQITEGVEAVTVCANLGAGTAGAVDGLRLMAGPGDMRYGLFRDAGHNEPSGHSNYPDLGAPSRMLLTVVDGQASGTLTVYGQVPGAQQALPPGTYASVLSDTDAVFYFDEGDAADCSGQQSTQASLSVSADVLANCLMNAGNLKLGVTGMIDHNIDAIGDVAVACTPTTACTITLDDGHSSSGGVGQRRLRSGSNYITYELYQDSARQTPWSAASPLAGEGIGDGQTYSVYGRIPPQNASVGSYDDTVVVTIFYDD